jgi:hypothetical protein
MALGVTLFTELSGMAAFSWFKKHPPKRYLLTCLLINLVVHPSFWFGFSYFPGTYPTNLYVGEGVVVICEAALYAFFLREKILSAICLSTVLNTLSFFGGIALWKMVR